MAGPGRQPPGRRCRHRRELHRIRCAGAEAGDRPVSSYLEDRATRWRSRGTRFHGVEPRGRIASCVRTSVRVEHSAVDEVDKGNYRHHMQKEIFEQPRALRQHAGDRKNRPEPGARSTRSASEFQAAVLDDTRPVDYHCRLPERAITPASVARYWIEEHGGHSLQRGDRQRNSVTANPFVHPARQPVRLASRSPARRRIPWLRCAIAQTAWATSTTRSRSATSPTSSLCARVGPGAHDRRRGRRSASHPPRHSPRSSPPWCCCWRSCSAGGHGPRRGQGERELVAGAARPDRP